MSKKRSKIHHYVQRNLEKNTLEHIVSSVCRDAVEHIAELEAQIEKMKNCFNCAKGDWENRVKCIKSGCVNKDKWEMKENG